MGSNVFPRSCFRSLWIGNKTFYKIIITEREEDRPGRKLKNARLLRSAYPCSLRRMAKYASLLGIPPACRRQGRPRERDFASSTRICLPAEASAQAGAFLSILNKDDFFRTSWVSEITPSPAFATLMILIRLKMIIFRVIC